MAYIGNPVVWAGVVVRTADGKTWAVEMDGTQSRITWELNRTVDFVDDWLNPTTRYVQPTGMTVEMRLTGYGVPWRAWAKADPAPAGELPTETRAIES